MRHVAWLPVLLALSAAASENAQATFPGHNGRIVFSLESRAGRTPVQTLRDYNPRTRRVRRLSMPTCDNRNWEDRAPDYSPDGRHIVYLHEDRCPGGAERTGVWVMRADGSKPRRLVPPPASPTRTPHSVAFSSDGGRIAVTYLEIDVSGNRVDLYVLEVFSVRDGTMLQHHQRPDDHQWTGGLDWSSRDSIAAALSGNIHFLSADGSSDRTRTRSRVDAWPDWSPSGRMIVFVRDHETNCETCYEGGWVMRASAGAGPARVRLRQHVYSPVVSPGANRIAYTDSYALYSMGLRRGHPRRLTRSFPSVGYTPIGADGPIGGIDWQPQR